MRTFDYKDKGIFASVADLFFWLGIICELTVSFSGYLFGSYHEMLIIVVGMACFSVKILMSMDLKKDMWLFALCGVYGLICYKTQSSALLLRMFLILLAGRDQDARKVFKLFFYGTLIPMLVVGILSALGIYGELLQQGLFKQHYDEIRYCFGFIHPNSFAFFLFRVLLMGIYVYYDRIKWWMYIIISAVYFPLILLSDSTVGLVMGVFAILFFAIANINFNKLWMKIIYIAGCILMFVEIGFAYVSMVCYDPHFGPDGYAVGFWQTINQNFFTGRIATAYNAFHELTIMPFGMNKDIVTSEIGFITGLFSYGYIFMAIYVVMLFMLFREMYKQNNKAGMVLIVSATLYSFSEAFLPYVNKNPVLMLGIGCLLVFSSGRSAKASSEEDVKSDRKNIKIKYVDFWPGFNPEDNYFTNILREKYDVTVPDDPDYIIASSFGNRHIDYNGCVKILFTGENITPDFNLYDYAMGFQYITYEDRYIRLPLYALYTDVIPQALRKHQLSDEEYLSRKGFCNYVISNPDTSGDRDRIIDAIATYKVPDSGGRYRNNVGGPVKDKLKFASGYRFSIAAENTSGSGYTTEKILDLLRELFPSTLAILR